MESRCWNCRSVQPYLAAPFRRELCAYCGANLTRPPVLGRVRWAAHRPPGSAPGRSEIRRSPYGGPPAYRNRPLWGFPPSVWIPSSPPDQPPPRAPRGELRSVRIFARATAVLCLLAAAAESWRYVLLVRGRTEVLRATEVRINDAFVVAASWGALLLALVTAATFVPAIARTEAFATARAKVRPSRRPADRLSRLLVPGWNLYGAGAVLAEVDALVGRAAPPPAPVPSAAPLRWRTRELPTVAAPSMPTANLAEIAVSDPSPGEPPPPEHHTPHRLISWWWAAWVLNGVLAAVVAVRTLIPGSLQVQANLVELHVVLALVGAVVAVLTAAVVKRWLRLVTPHRETFPAGWILQPAGQTVGSGASPSPATESTSS